MPHSKGFGNRRDTRSTDPIAIGDIVDGLLQEDLFSRGMPIANLLRAWPGIRTTVQGSTPVEMRQCRWRVDVWSCGPPTGPGVRRRSTSQRRSEPGPTTPSAAVP